MKAKRKTDERAKILGVLVKTHLPLTAQEVKKRAGPSVHLATVYRALAALTEEGLVRRVDLGGRAPRYESAKQHHHHLVCTSCGRIEDVGECIPKGTEARVLKKSKHFGKITSHSLEFFALCNKCIKK